MTLQTASEGISFARDLENKTAAFYEELATRFPEKAETFRSYAKANQRNVSNIERAYYGVITDAIEGCYAFKIEPEDFVIDVATDGISDLAGAVAKAVKNEETLVRFFNEAAEQAKGTMADVPRTFQLVSRKHGERIEELKAMAG